MRSTALGIYYHFFHYKFYEIYISLQQILTDLYKKNCEFIVRLKLANSYIMHTVHPYACPESFQYLVHTVTDSYTKLILKFHNAQN